MGVTFMKDILRGLALILLAVTVSGCALNQLKWHHFSDAKRVGVLNELPGKPAFTNIGTTIFNNDFAEVEDDSVRQFASDELVAALRAKGFDVEEISVADDIHSFDVVFKIVPRESPRLIHSSGYGVWEKSVGGVALHTYTYASLGLESFVKGKEFHCYCAGESLTQIGIADLPATWKQLDEASQASASASAAIKNDIKAALLLALERAPI